MTFIHYLLFKKNWTNPEHDRIIAQRLLGLSLVAGLLFLLTGCILSAIYGVDPSALPGKGLTGR